MDKYGFYEQFLQNCRSIISYTSKKEGFICFIVDEKRWKIPQNKGLILSSYKSAVFKNDKIQSSAQYFQITTILISNYQSPITNIQTMALQTAERVSSHEASDNVIFQRHLVAYNEAAKLIYGNVLEVGSGEGYGIELLASKAERYQAIDKYNTSVESYAAKFPHVHFQQMNIPPIEFPENTFDCIVTFQVIEHIEDDAGMVSEMARVLKPGGLLVLTTPNIKMSLTRNPWHVREYTVSQLKGLLQRYFSEVDMKGVYGNQKVMDYYNANKKIGRKNHSLRHLQPSIPPPSSITANSL